MDDSDYPPQRNPGRCRFCDKPVPPWRAHHPECADAWWLATKDQRKANRAAATIAHEHLVADIRTRRGEALSPDDPGGHTLARINGCGTCLYGRSDVDPATQSYVATKWFTLLFIPVLPLGRYRVIQTDVRRYAFLGRVPLRAFDWAQPFIWATVILLLSRACASS